MIKIGKKGYTPLGILWIIVKHPAKCEKFLCQKSYSFQGF